MSKDNIIEEALSLSPNRRSLLKKLAVAGAAVGATITTGDTLQAQATPAPADVVQFGTTRRVAAKPADLSGSVANFEDIGVSAYGGGAPFLSGSPFLQTAARILAVEGEHVANIRLQIARLGIPTFAIDGADIIPPPSGSNFFSTNPANGLTAIRTPGQVLYLAYGNMANATAGGFFPSGVNGVLNTSSGPATAANLT